MSSPLSFSCADLRKHFVSNSELSIPARVWFEVISLESNVEKSVKNDFNERKLSAQDTVSKLFNIVLHPVNKTFETLRTEGDIAFDFSKEHCFSILSTSPMVITTRHKDVVLSLKEIYEKELLSANESTKRYFPNQRVLLEGSDLSMLGKKKNILKAFNIPKGIQVQIEGKPLRIEASLIEDKNQTKVLTLSADQGLTLIFRRTEKGA